MEEEEEQQHPLLQTEKIIVEIVSRLPFDSILQCRRVCKSWHTLLRGSYFNQIYTHHLPRLLLQQQHQHLDCTMNLFPLIGTSSREQSMVILKEDYDTSCFSPMNFLRLISTLGEKSPMFKLEDYDDTPMNLFRLIGTSAEQFMVNLEDYYSYDDGGGGGDHEQLHQVHIPRNYTIVNKELLTWDYIGADGIWSIMGSCNGLICLFDCDEYFIVPPVIIYNPITRECVNLPHSGEESTDVGTSAGGFGYLPLTNEYKVVRIIHHRPTTTDKLYIRCVRIYTLGSGEWRSKEEEEEELVDYSFSSKGVLLNGSLYWLSIDGGKILAFDLKDEKFRIIPSPPPPCLLSRDDLTSRAACDIGVLGKLLCITEHKGFTTDIWVKNTYTKKDSNNNPRERYWWSNAFTIKLSVPPVMQSSNRSLCEPIALTKRGRILCLYNRIHVICFDPRTNSCVSFEEDDHKGDGLLEKDYNPRSIPYTKSFVSLKALGEDDAKIVERAEVQQYRVNMMYGNRDLQYPYNSFGDTGGRIISDPIPYSSTRTLVHQKDDEEKTTENKGDMKRKIIKLCTSFLLHLLVVS